MPILTAPKLNDNMVCMGFCDGSTQDAIVQQQSLEILRKGDVAAAAQDAKLGVIKCTLLMQIAQLVGVCDGKVLTGVDIKTEGVERLEWLVFGVGGSCHSLQIYLYWIDF